MNTRKLRPTLIGTLGVALAFLAGSGTARATLIDFEDVAVPTGSFSFVEPVDSTGFRFAAPQPFTGAENDFDGAFNGTTHYFTYEHVTMTRIGGGTFSLLSFDAGEDFDFGFGRHAPTLSLTGFLSGGGSLTQSFAIDGLYDGTGGIADFQQFILGPGWTDLISVEFVGTGVPPSPDEQNNNFVLDNLAVATPEPGTLALLGLGLAGLGFTRRRRAA